MSEYVVGQIVPLDPGYPQPQQPGGPGAPVTPWAPRSYPPGASTNPDINGTPEERTGKWKCGYCPATFNNWEYLRVPLDGVVSALVLCPVCRTISRIVTPADAMHSEVEMAIVS